MEEFSEVNVVGEILRWSAAPAVSLPIGGVLRCSSGRAPSWESCQPTQPESRSGDGILPGEPTGYAFWRVSLPSFLRFVLRKNVGSSRMPEFQRHEKRVGLHSAVFRKSALQANGLWFTSSRKPARSAKVRLAGGLNSVYRCPLHGDPVAVRGGARPGGSALRSSQRCDSKIANHCELSDCPGAAEALQSDGHGFLSRWESGRLASRAASI